MLKKKIMKKIIIKFFLTALHDSFLERVEQLDSVGNEGCTANDLIHFV